MAVCPQYPVNAVSCDHGALQHIAGAGPGLPPADTIVKWKAELLREFCFFDDMECINCSLASSWVKRKAVILSGARSAESKNLRITSTFAVKLVPRSFDSLRSLRMTTLLQHLVKLQFSELSWSRGPEDVHYAIGFVTNWPPGLPGKLQFAQEIQLPGLIIWQAQFALFC